jgi:hypothetical protein
MKGERDHVFFFQFSKHPSPRDVRDILGGGEERKATQRRIER